MSLKILNRYGFVLLLINLFLSGCTKMQSTAAKIDSRVHAEVERYSDEQSRITEVSNLYFQLFQKSYLRTLLEMQPYQNRGVGESRRPYSDSWYQEGTGGTNVGAALEQYDKAFYGGEPKSVDWEVKNHTSNESDWYGHCNGFAANVSRHQDPARSVVRPKGCSGNACVTFTPAHIRALLAEIYMSTLARNLSGERCEESSPTDNPANRADPTSMDACVDVNPASFHLSLVNWIGVQGQVLIFDYDRKRPVWNFPLYAYRYSSTNVASATAAMNATGRSGSYNTWIYNPLAVKFSRIRMEVDYAKALGSPTSNNSGDSETDKGTKVYEYILAMDTQDNIIGGEWINNSKQDHPDFLWFPFQPFAGSGNRRFANPHISPNEVLDIWAESMNFDPENPYGKARANSDYNDNPNTILFAPSGRPKWGTVDQYFSMLLDGSNSGVAFLGKDIELNITRGQKLSLGGQGSVRLTLNDNVSTTINFTGDDTINWSFRPKTGINTLEVTWLNPDFRPEPFLFYGM
ncbi:MAG: hypothetical protein CMP10_16180 [Zetaproteobacteria bacterium]|nr:hypothetical protein [Pseudobdellovibrionaceae bacterium]